MWKKMVILCRWLNSSSQAATLGKVVSRWNVTKCQDDFKTTKPRLSYSFWAQFVIDFKPVFAPMHPISPFMTVLSYSKWSLWTRIKAVILWALSIRETCSIWPYTVLFLTTINLVDTSRLTQDKRVFYSSAGEKVLSLCVGYARTPLNCLAGAQNSSPH